MFKQNYFIKPTPIRFKQFSRKGYALFSCLGREVIIGTLSVATLAYAKADGISVREDLSTDSLRREEVGLDEVVVLGSRAPLTVWQSGEHVEVITSEEIECSEASTVNDVLKLATGVDVRQRGGFGVQTDISIGGGTFDQMVILLNGVNISNPQTGHNATDFPISLHDIERIEIIEGASSRVFGASAFGGAINIVTKGSERKSGDKDVMIGMESGSFGTFGVEGSASLFSSPTPSKGWLAGGRASAGWTRSDGGTKNSDFNKVHTYANTKWSNEKTDLDLQVGWSAQDYGANTFYSAKYDNQYEETRRLIASATANRLIVPGVSLRGTLYAKHFGDHYWLIRGINGSNKGENKHRLWVYGGSTDFNIDWHGGRTSVGADIHWDVIRSSALGDHTRRHESLFAEHNVVLRKWTLSTGVHYGRLWQDIKNNKEKEAVWSPGVNISYRPSHNWKLYASWNKSMRLPTFTDLYISNVVQQGDASLKSERGATLKGGVVFRTNGFNATISAFKSHGRNMIDWVYASKDAERYEALNIGKLDITGFSADTKYHRGTLTIGLGYAFMNEKHWSEREIWRSLYALDYVRHKLVLQVIHNIPLPHSIEQYGKLNASWSARWQQRMNGYTPYWKIDGKLEWSAKHWNLYLKADNLTNHHYFDISGVEQPGLWILAGVNLKL